MEQKKVILCIDDDQEILDSLRTILETKNYLVKEADTYESAIKEFDNTKPDFVLVDLMMDKIDAGMKIVKNIRELDKKVPVYLLSGVGNQFHSNCDATEVGFNGVFQKPIKPQLLLEVISDKLD